jgi:hypothetical protein
MDFSHRYKILRKNSRTLAKFIVPEKVILLTPAEGCRIGLPAYVAFLTPPLVILLFV